MNNYKGSILDKDGITIPTLLDEMNFLIEQFKVIYGNDIDLSQDTADGQRIEIFAKIKNDLTVLLKYVYENLKPDNAESKHLDNLARINGISRRQATFSSVDVVIEANTPFTIEQGFTVEDTNNNLWVVDNGVPLNIGKNTVTLYAKEVGNIEALPNQVTNPTVIDNRIIKIYNPLKSINGVDEESDEMLRKRRLKTFANASYQTISGISARLNNINNVYDAVVYENNTNEFDKNLKLDPHSIWCIVQGGAVADIIECIAKNKTLGTGLKGKIEQDYTDSIKRNDGALYEVTHKYKFDRPKLIDIYLKVKVKRLVSNEPVAVSELKDHILNTIFYIGEHCKVTSFYCKINSIARNFYAYDLEISKDKKAWYKDYLKADHDELFTLKRENIIIDEIV